MAAGDLHSINRASVTADAVEITLTGYTGTIPLTAASVTDVPGDATQKKARLTFTVDSWPVLTSANGTTGSLGAVSLVTKANKVLDEHGKYLPGGQVLWSGVVNVATPTVTTVVTAAYVSGLGASGQTFTDPNALQGFGSVVVDFTSTEV